MNILVTGGNGFIGSSLVNKLRNNPKVGNIYVVTRKGSKNAHIPVSSRIITVEYDGTVKSLSEAVRGSDYCIHLGAFYSTRKDDDTVEQLLRSNIDFSVHLFQAVTNENPSASVVSTSTFSSFDSDYKYAPQSLYAATKSAIEVLAAGFPINAAFLRLPDTYGPGDWRTKVHNLLRDAVNRKDNCFNFMKPQEQEINLAHVNDVSRALLHAARMVKEENKKEVQAFDLFYPENNITLGEVADLLIKGKDTAVSFPMFGEVAPLPPQRHRLPHFQMEYDPHFDLAETLYSEVIR